MPIRLVLADDHPAVLAGLEQLLMQESDFAVAATCASGEEALQAVREHAPDVLVLDLRMPCMDGFAVVRALRAEQLPTHVIILTASLDPSDALEAARLGVADIVLKDMATEGLVQAIRKFAHAVRRRG